MAAQTPEVEMLKLTETRTVEGTEVKFFTTGGRWVFAGSRNGFGYLTVEDAEVEAQLQLSNQYVGSLNTYRPGSRIHRTAVQTLATLMNRR